MSWILDESKDLVNLDKVAKLSVAAVEDPEADGPSHCLIAYFEQDEHTTWLKGGTEKECNDLLDRIVKKLHVIG